MQIAADNSTSKEKKKWTLRLFVTVFCVTKFSPFHFCTIVADVSSDLFVASQTVFLKWSDPQQYGAVVWY